MKMIVLTIALFTISCWAVAAPKDEPSSQYSNYNTSNGEVAQGSDEYCNKIENSRGCINGRKITSFDIDEAARSAPTYPVHHVPFPHVEYIRR